MKRLAIVTGGTAGIGLAAARAFAGRGYAVVVAARGREGVGAAVGGLGGEALGMVGDVAEEGFMERVAGAAVEKFGRVDVLVNNAGYAGMGVTAEISPAEWRRIVDVNLTSVFLGTRAVWEVMKRQGGGVIVNVSSMAAKDPFAGLGAYGAAKAGVNLLTLATAREGAAVGIRVYCVGPGAVDTAMLRGVLGGKRLAEGEMLRAEEVAGVIVGMAEGEGGYGVGETVYLRAGGV